MRSMLPLVVQGDQLLNPDGFLDCVLLTAVMLQDTFRQLFFLEAGRISMGNHMDSSAVCE